MDGEQKNVASAREQRAHLAFRIGSYRVTWAFHMATSHRALAHLSRHISRLLLGDGLRAMLIIFSLRLRLTAQNVSFRT